MNLISCRDGKRVSFRRNHKEGEAETWHTCLGHYPLHKLCFFYFDRIRTLVAMSTFSSDRLIMGKVEIDNFCQVIGGYLKLFLHKCLLSSPPCFIRLLSKSLNLIG